MNLTFKEMMTLRAMINTEIDNNNEYIDNLFDSTSDIDKINRQYLEQDNKELQNIYNKLKIECEKNRE